MSSAVSLPNHTFTGQAWSSKRLTSIVHSLSPETDNCPSWISGRERMTVENISWSISTKECCRPRRGLNPRPPGLQSDGASNWATEAGCAHSFSRNWQLPFFSNPQPLDHQSDAHPNEPPRPALNSVCLFVLRFYGPVNPMGSCQAWSIYLTTRLLGSLSPLSG